MTDDWITKEYIDETIKVAQKYIDSLHTLNTMAGIEDSELMKATNKAFKASFRVFDQFPDGMSKELWVALEELILAAQEQIVVRERMLH